MCAGPSPRYGSWVCARVRSPDEVYGSVRVATRRLVYGSQMISRGWLGAAQRGARLALVAVMVGYKGGDLIKAVLLRTRPEFHVRP